MEALTCGLLKYLNIRPAGRAAYEALAQYHYRDGALGPVRAIYAMTDEHPRRRQACPAVGVIVYGCPVANLGIRTVATGGLFAGLERAAGLSMLNARMVTIRRVIIEPRYRGLGLAARLVRDTMPMTGAEMVEAIAAMGQVHPFFSRAGMTEYTPGPDAKTARMQAALETVGIGEELWADLEAVQSAIHELDEPAKAFIERETRRFLEKFATQRNMEPSKERTEFVLSKLAGPGRYYLWIKTPYFISNNLNHRGADKTAD
jgi:GNAT superfamily N-acetyltransferase